MSTPPTSVYDLFVSVAARFSVRPFLAVEANTAAAYGIAPVEIGYAEAAQAISNLLELYRSAGYAAGQRVGLALQNRPDHFLHFLALNGLGISVVPLDDGQPPSDLGYIIAHSDLCLIVTLQSAISKFTKICAGLDKAIPVIPCGNPPPRLAQPAPPQDFSTGAQSEAALLYTSGTTGRPKGCRLSNAYFLEFGNQYAAYGGLCALDLGHERLITPLPVSHMNAMVCSFMAMLTVGGCVIQLDRFHPTSWWDSVYKCGATLLHYLGVMPAMLLLRAPEDHENCRGRIKFGFGAGVNSRHHARFEQRFGFPLIEAWAMTETGPGACVAATHEPRHVGTRCFGRVPSMIEIRLVNEEGADAGEGEPSELLVRHSGPDGRAFFFSGYHKDEEATETAWAGGWFHTGDVVSKGADGSLFFVDRRKNIIRRSGENIAAVEVENALQQHPAISACAVAPVPDDLRGEEVAASVVLAEGQEASPALAADIARHCLTCLPYYKIPGYIVFSSALPMTASQKIQRGQLKALLAEAITSMNAHDMRELKRRSR